MNASSKGFSIFLGSLNFITAITAVIGNSLIINALRRNHSLHSPSKALLFCLALTDLGVGLLVQPIFAIKTFAEVKEMPSVLVVLRNSLISQVLPVIFIIVSIWTLTTIAVDRFLALHLRQRYRAVVTLRRLLPLLVSYWICSGLLVMFYTWLPTYFFITVSVNVFLCIVISSFSFVKVYLKVRHQVQIQDGGEQNPNANVFSMARYKKSVETMLCVYIVFLISYLPQIGILMATAKYGLSEPTVSLLHRITCTIIYINSSVNPVVYCWRIREIRQIVLQSLLNPCSKC